MEWSNPWFVAALVGVIGLFHIELIADLLNVARLPRPPADGQVLPDKERERLVEYNSAHTAADVFRRSFFLAALLIFWLAGGFGWLDTLVRGWGWSATWTGVAVIALLAIAKSILDLPFELHDTFVIEERFGFNRTTLGTFAADRLKGLLLAALLGLPLLAFVVWLFESTPLAALYAWVSVAIFSIVMSWLAPRLIMPLFLKFKALEDGPLRQQILSLADKLKFPVQEVSVVDGSRRSSKANAFFTGFGKTKRIALFDTLLESHSQEEILAILAHEIGHFKKKHVIQQMAAGLLQMGLMFALLHLGLHSPGLFSAFGVQTISAGMGLVLFSLVYGPLSALIETLQLALSRKHEFEADAYAAAAMGDPAPLSQGLKRLTQDHLSHPNPHPFYVWLHYTHPAVGDRVRALHGAAG